MIKDRRHFNTMTENGLDIQTISTKRTDKQADRVLLLVQVTERKEKAISSQSQNIHFFANVREYFEFYKSFKLGYKFL